MLKTKMLAMFGGVAVMASALVPGMASAQDRDDWRDGDRYAMQQRMDAADWARNEHARLHTENPYMTPRQHERMHRWLREQREWMARREMREERGGWRAEHGNWRGEDAPSWQRWGDRDGNGRPDRWVDRDRDGRPDHFQERDRR